ncbi:MAG: acetate kinase [Desulfocapsa sp.]|uniref:Acetate kinase n=1 Tax=Desulfotalea psychrophila TaxID=84980 RepID=A0ABS3AWC7_9BACT|nr:acetate kinase [Desulfocapsa sp.]MBN4068850.1 acetate kinase [Desulfotalea psychrophila]
MKILVLNAGSSSLKFQLFNMDDLSVLATGMIEQIGNDIGQAKLACNDDTGGRQETEVSRVISDHSSAIELMTVLLQENGVLTDVNELAGVGHRVVHGGEDFRKPVIITDKVIRSIRELVPLAPLHNPANITGIEVVTAMAPSVPQVAVFDTAFHQSIPQHAYLYALPYKLYEEYKIRRYGFHGTSHAYVSKKAAAYLNCSYKELKIITLHLGNGASAAAIDCGQCVDTSMGFTPLEGLVMGTRSGDLDPAILFYLARETGMDFGALDSLLNKESGLKGICGNNDMRTIGKMAAAGDAQPLLALEIFCYRIKKYIGAYLAVLGGADCVVFTGGIGENDTKVRAKCLHGMERLGVALDLEKNDSQNDGIMEIQKADSRCKILVVPTDEEFEIATQTMELIG